jgi:ERCC4-type nuclease
MSAYIDTRERELLKRLSWPAKALPVGDVWIGLSGEVLAPGGICAERKTAADLEASILDGRYREQRTRLLSYCQINHLRPLYIIEGDLDRLGARLAKKALVKHLARLTLRYGVSVLQTESLEDTARLCETLAEQIKEDSRVFMTEEAAKVQYTDTISVVKKGNREDPSVFLSAILQQCPGISAAGATAILKQYPTFPKFYAATEKDFMLIQIGTKRLGPVVAKRLWNFFHSDA